MNQEDWKKECLRIAAKHLIEELGEFELDTLYKKANEIYEKGKRENYF